MINQLNLTWIMDHPTEEDNIKIRRLSLQTKLVEDWLGQRMLSRLGKLWRKFQPFMLNDQDPYSINLDKDQISLRVMLFMLHQILQLKDHII
jgi:hypothetical protein